MLFRTAMKEAAFLAVINYEMMQIRCNCRSLELVQHYTKLVFLKRYLTRPNNIALIRHLALNWRRVPR